MTRSKEEKAAFIAHLRAAAKELGETNPTIPSNLLDSFSPSNALMILLQKPSVRKGAKGLAILVPLGAKDDSDTPIFSWRYVFDISDTQELTDSSPRLARELVGA
jgi:hypothetical protein